MSALLELENVCVDYRSHGRRHRAVDGVSLRVEAGESVGIVGESGCGKSTIAKAVVGLEPVATGTIRYDGRSLADFVPADWRTYRRRVQLVFQDALGSLNPRLGVGAAIEEVLRVHARREQPTPAARRARVRELLDVVELSARLADRYPHELSGGQRQRIALARALAVRPRLLIADEPVSALDVAVQAQVIHLLDRLRRELGVATLFIAHDLAVVRALCPTAHVMHCGRVVESGPTDALFTSPQDAYTRRLLAAVPDIGRGLAARRTAEAGT